MNQILETFEAHVQIYFKLHPPERKYESAENSQKIVARMRSFGLSVASDTMVSRAIAELVRQGVIHRADGGSAETDRTAAATAARARIDRIANAPLTTTDFERYSRMSPAEVEHAFYSDAVFAARYRKASERWGFLLPAKPASSQDDVPVEADLSKWRTLTAKDYYAMSVADVRRLYKTDPGFRRATDRLIKCGAI